MRHVLLKDLKITNDALLAWKVEDIAFWEKYLGVTPTYEVIETDYTTYPTYIDEDGDIRPTYDYLQKKTNEVVKKFGDFGTDFIMVMVHEDNWRSDTDTTKGIWGTSYSYKFGDQHLEYCRWDKDNPANTFGTAYHERMHTPDAFTKVELGIDLDTVVETHLRKKFADDKEIVSYLDKNGFRWDRDVTHGGMRPPFSYIRWKQNVDILPIIKPLLVQAFTKRKEKHDKVMMGYQQTIIGLLQQVVYLLRKKFNVKDGVPRS